MLKLGVDARDLATDTRGIGRYARAVLRFLAQRDDFNIRLLVKARMPFTQRKRYARILRGDRFEVSNSTRGIDVIWHPANGTFFSAVAPAVATIHDAVPFRFPPENAARRRSQQEPFLRSAAQAARIIAVSHFGASEVHEALSVPLERIDVVYHGVEPFFAPGPAGDTLPPALRQHPYFLFVGDPGAEPRKNFALLHAAYRNAFADGGPALAVVGASGSLPRDVINAGVARGDASGERDAYLRALYRGALALCMPSYYETFGMPMAEAMACGVPVIAARSSCLPEIGGDAPVYVDPHDVAGWTQALRRVATDETLRMQLVKGGIERAKRYDWAASAQRHAEIFRKVGAR